MSKIRVPLPVVDAVLTAFEGQPEERLAAALLALTGAGVPAIVESSVGYIAVRPGLVVPCGNFKEAEACLIDWLGHGLLAPRQVVWVDGPLAWGLANEWACAHMRCDGRNPQNGTPCEMTVQMILVETGCCSPLAAFCGEHASKLARAINGAVSVSLGR